MFSLFMGTAMSISALPVIAKTLIDLNMLKSKVGMIIIAAAMFDDLIGWLIFSDVPASATLLGALVILGSTIWLARRESRRSSQA
ncbi:MAG: hypothetical protein EBV72_10170 [Betaproteobacteria bacterium]|nr:hypothetical protein [Betaproteobacteria bacterium]